jgi:hypothetical protein
VIILVHIITWFSINAGKTKCIKFSPTKHAASTTSTYALFSVAGKTIENVRQWDHLGHLVSASRTDIDDIKERERACTLSVKLIICYANFAILTRIIQCIPRYSFYGCELCKLDNTELQYLCAARRKCMRRIWDPLRSLYSELHRDL